MDYPSNPTAVCDIENPPAAVDEDELSRRALAEERTMRRWSFWTMLLGALLTPLVMLYFGKFLRLVLAWCVATDLNVTMCDKELKNLSAEGALSPHPSQGHYGLDWLVGVPASLILLCLCRGSPEAAGCCGCCCAVVSVLGIVAIVEFAGCS